MGNINEFFKETIDINSNLSVYDKESIKLVIIHFIGLFNRLGVDVPIENISTLLSELKSINNYDPKLTEKAFLYDSATNTMINNKRHVKDDNRRLYDNCMMVLDIMSKKFDPETRKYNDGLIYEDENGHKFGTKINEKLKHRLVTLLTDVVVDEENIKDFYVDKPDDPCTLEDTLLIDINSVISTEDLLTHFISADGISFYQAICNTLDNEQIAKDLLSTIDEYNKDKSIEQRKKYDEVMKMIKEQQLTRENNMKIA